MVIFKTVMSTDHKTQKESYARRSADYYLFYFILFYLFFFCLFVFCSQNLSCGEVLLVCCSCTRNLHEMRNFHENLCVYVCAYVCMDCCNINESIEIDTVDGAVGSRNYGVKTRLI